MKLLKEDDMCGGGRMVFLVLSAMFLCMVSCNGSVARHLPCSHVINPRAPMLAEPASMGLYQCEKVLRLRGGRRLPAGSERRRRTKTTVESRSSSSELPLGEPHEAVEEDSDDSDDESNDDESNAGPDGDSGSDKEDEMTSISYPLSPGRQDRRPFQRVEVHDEPPESMSTGEPVQPADDDASEFLIRLRRSRRALVLMTAL